LVRADGVGDALVCAPLVAALQRSGHAVSAVLGARNRDAFVAGTFGHVHVLERIAWPAHGSTRASWDCALAAARAARYDVALVASEELDAYAFAREAGIPTRVGFVHGLSKPLKSLQVRALLTRAVVRSASARNTREHEVRVIFALGRALVRETEPTRDVARLRALVVGAGPCTTAPAIALQVSPKFARAGLDRAAFVACARMLRARGDEVLVLGDDDALVRAVAAESDATPAGGLELAAWMRRIAGARALVTGDSGAAHVAGMTGVPTVDAFAPGPATAYDVRRWSPWAARSRALVLDPTQLPTETARVLVRALDEVLAT